MEEPYFLSNRQGVIGGDSSEVNIGGLSKLVIEIDILS
jgi:hypothetical protein